MIISAVCNDGVMSATTVWTSVFCVALVLALTLIGLGHFRMARTLRRHEAEIPLPTVITVATGWALFVVLLVVGFLVEIHRNSGYRS
jgi:hypothetical protein